MISLFLNVPLEGRFFVDTGERRTMIGYTTTYKDSLAVFKTKVENNRRSDVVEGILVSKSVSRGRDQFQLSYLLSYNEAIGLKIGRTHMSKGIS